MASIEEYGLTLEKLRQLRQHLGFSIPALQHYYASNQANLKIINHIEQWELGQSVPTFKQLKTLIEDIYRYPFIAIFAEILPDPKIGQANFRATMPLDHPKVMEFCNKFTLLQEEIRSLLQATSIENNETITKLDFIGSIHYQEVSSIDLANMLRARYYPTAKNVEKNDFLKELIANIENAGIFVCVDESFNQKKLPSDYGFSGMAIADEIAPLIVIISNQAPARKLFTLIHELAHLYIGHSNITDGSSYLVADKADKVERYCNEVAGNFFVPNNILQNYEKLGKGDLVQLAQTSHASFIMVAYRAYQLKKISQDEFHEYYSAYKDKVEEHKNNKSNFNGSPKRSAAQRAKATFKPKIRSLFYKALMSEVTDKIELSHIMNLKPSAVYEVLGIK